LQLVSFSVKTTALSEDVVLVASAEEVKNELRLEESRCSFSVEDAFIKRLHLRNKHDVLRPTRPALSCLPSVAFLAAAA
jgi:hypothetical protein